MTGGGLQSVTGAVTVTGMRHNGIAVGSAAARH